MICACIFISCSKKEGCTDNEAVNYDTKAEENDGSCEFNGRVDFYTTNCSAVNDSGEKITIYINGNYFHSLNNCFPVSGATSPCNIQTVNLPGGQPSYWNYYFDKPGTYSYTAYDIDSTITWNGNFTLTAKGSFCLDLE